MVRSVCLVVLLSGALLGGAGSARADCRVSASRTWSFDVRLSPLAGRACLLDARVFEGGTCGPEAPRWSATFGCSEASRMAVTDDGALVSLLAGRASRRDWEIVRIFERDGGSLAVRSIRLDELPGLPSSARRPRLSLDATALRVHVVPAVTVPLSALRALGRVAAHRPAR